MATVNQSIRLYTLSIKGRSKTHALVNQAYDKGLTGVRILKYPNKAAPMARSGWYLECNETQALHLGYDVTEASNRINQIKLNGPGYKELYKVFESGTSVFTELSFAVSTPVDTNHVLNRLVTQGPTEHRIDFVMMAPGLVTEISGCVKAFTEHEAVTKVLQISELYK